MDAKAAETRAFYAKTDLNFLVVLMTENSSIYLEKASFCWFYVVYVIKVSFYVKSKHKTLKI